MGYSRYSEIGMSANGSPALAFKAIGVFSLAVLSCTCGCALDPSPPDLSACTRIEVRWDPSLLEYCLHFFPSRSVQALVSPSEQQYLTSHGVLVIDDPGRIKAVAEKVREGQFKGSIRSLTRKVQWVLPGPPFIRVTCFRGEKECTSFSLSSAGSEMLTEDGRRFAYRAVWDYWRILEPPEFHPFKLRAGCAVQLSSIARIWDPRYTDSYPEATRWCDAVVQAWSGRLPHQKLSERAFTCPSARERTKPDGSLDGPIEPNSPTQEGVPSVSHYALNPNCKLDSPSDMVLLFEAEPGWNQHGGPELFAFDNHDPKGGCVVLKDGTVRFIRTEAELHALRWE